VDGRRERLAALTRRWRERHDARRPAAEERPPAEPEREARAAALFPFRSMTPDAYAELYGDEMVGFTYDEARYAEPELDAWLLALGEALRRRREAEGGSGRG
jgi:hypothetical protein